MDVDGLGVRVVRSSTAFSGCLEQERPGTTFLTDTLHTRPAIVVSRDG